MAKRGRKKGQKGKCSVCGVEGHTKRTCPTLKKKKKAQPEKEKPKKAKKVPAPPEPTKEQIEAAVKKASEFNLNTVVWRLLQQEAFFAAISRHIDKSRSYLVPTAGVRFNEKTLQFELLYNPLFMSQLTEAQQTDVLKHEYFHVVLDHVTGRMPPSCKDDPKIAKRWNFATDLAINSHLTNLPEGCLKPGQGPCKALPEGGAAEWYYHNLPKELQDLADQAAGGQGQGNCPSCGGSGKNDQGDDCESCGGSGQAPGVGDDGQVGDHSGWCGENQMDDATKEFAKERMKEIARKAVQEANERASWGTVSEKMKSDIMKLLYSMVDWKKVLRYFIKTSQKADKSTSIRRINKRYPYIHAGKKTNRTASLAVCIDESGSVGDKLLARFFAELNKLADLASFTVIPFDHEVAEENIYIWRKGQHKLPKRVRCGGTCFDAPTKYVNEHNFDGMIVLTDMCAPKPGRCKVQRLWMTNEANAENPYFKPAANERIVAVKADNDW